MMNDFSLYLQNHPQLIPGILKSARISTHHPNHEDYQQDVTLFLLQRYNECQTLEDFEKTAFTYARCRFIDLVRKEFYRTQRQTSLQEDFDISYEAEFFLTPEFYQVLTPFEVLICECLLKDPCKKHTAQRLNISRAHFYRQLEVIRKKAKNYYQA